MKAGVILTGCILYIAYAEGKVLNECNDAMSCDDCFLAGPHCAWCASPDFLRGEWERCQNVEKFKSEGTCPKDHLIETELTPMLQKQDIEEHLVSVSKVMVNMRQTGRVSFPVSVLVPKNNRRNKDNVMVIGWKSGKKPIDLHIDSNCQNGKNKGHKYICKNVKKGEQVSFELTTHLKACKDKLKNGKYKVLVKIGNSKKIIQIETDYICQCKITESKKKCSYDIKRNVGSGNCILQDTVTAEMPPKPQVINVTVTCPYSESESMDRCRQNKQSDVCSYNGECQCGVCKCNKLFYGKYCDCSDHSCPRFHGFLCGGSSRGECKCGNCECTKGYTGNNCGCPTTNTTCLSSSGSLCNGKGFCICGECKCQHGFSGSTCENCPTCILSCDRFKQCAECLAIVGSTMPRSMCRAVCDGSVPEYSIRDRLLRRENAKICYHIGQDGCPLNFELVRHPKSSAFELNIEKRTDCKTSHRCRSNDHCLAADGTVCGGKGECNCGYCECQSGYAGSVCEQCTECPDMCQKYRDCVSCVAFNKGVLSPSQCQKDCSSMMPNIKVVTTLIGYNGKTCEMKDPIDDCMFSYLLEYDKEGELKIRILNQRVGCRSGGDLLAKFRKP